MRAFNERQRAGEFIVSLANGTRSQEEGLLQPGQEIADGTPVSATTEGELVPATTSAVEGVIIGNHNLSTDDDAKKVAYVARDAEVKEALLVLPTDPTQRANVLTGLASAGIILR